MTTGLIRLVSMSGGKDSTATALVALERHPRADLRFVFADTGNEHPITYEFIDYLECKLGITITRLRQDFSEWMARRRIYMVEKWPGKGVPQDVVDRAVTLAVCDPQDSRQQGPRHEQGSAGESRQPLGATWRELEPDVGRGLDGVFGWLDGTFERGIPRVAKGIPNRVARLRALGNAVVPQQAYPLFKAIAEIEGIHDRMSGERA